jgi:hypothetical protein
LISIVFHFAEYTAVTIQWSRMVEAIERSTENCRGEF